MGFANSTYFVFSDIGMGIGPLAVGFIIPFTGYRGIYMLMAVFAVVCLLLYHSFIHEYIKPFYQPTKKCPGREEVQTD